MPADPRIRSSDFFGGVPLGFATDAPRGSAGSFTLIEVFADDRIGLLYRITHALFTLGVDIRIAKIATKGDQVADVFYVPDLEGQKILEQEKTGRITSVLLQKLSAG